MVSKRLWQLWKENAETTCTLDPKLVREFCWRVNYDPTGVYSVLVVYNETGWRVLEVWVNENPNGKPFHPFTSYRRVEERWGL